ncbi:MAG: PQQ-binding-like beta-propeller repeat protein [Micropruina sp.]|uniref:outer membrane protein assembly factor BamB family protein n=1 Tax=Micropruina sp. TaxID=2737536 RepID=UPI0039E622DD
MAVVLGIVVAAANLGRPVSARDASAAMSYLPASDDRVVLQNSDGTDTVAEYYSTFGAQVWQSGPVAFGYGTDYDELTAKSWVRIAEFTAGADGKVRARRSRLLAAEPTGLNLRADVSDNDFVAFEPGLPVLPAGVRDGQRWTAAGTATLGSGNTASGRKPYAATMSARALNDGCVAIGTELTVGDDATPARTSETWCPGRGIVGTEQSGRTAAAVPRAPRWQSLGRVLPYAPPDLSGGWNFVRKDLKVPPLALYATVRPVLLPGPVVVYVNSPGGDLVARGWSDPATAPRWNAHPGGQITSVEAIGRVVVAVTTQRRVVAYGDQGEFLWQAALGDASAVPIARFAGLAVVAGLDGVVTAYQAETGAIAWTAQTPTEIRRPMVTDGGTLTVLDQAGNLLTLGPDGVPLHEFSTDPPELFAVADGVAVVASRGDNYLRGYRLTDGEQLWRIQQPGGRRSMHAFGTTVALGTTDSLIGLRAADGVRSWSAPLNAVQVAVQGDRLLVADRTTLHLLDGAGTELARYVTQEQDLSFGAGTFLVAGAGELFCFFGPSAYRRET